MLFRSADIKKKLEVAEATKEDMNIKEALVGWDPTEFEDLASAKEKLDPYEKLWKLVDDQQKANNKWTKTSLFKGELKPEEVETDVSTYWRLAFKLKAIFEQDNLSKPATVAAKLKSDLDAFKENVPLLHAMCNPGLRDRHWKEISTVIGFQFEPEPSMNLQRVLDMDLGTYVTEISDIAESAGKEFQIENGLAAQKGEWAPVNIEFKPWAETGTYIVAGQSVDETDRKSVV